MTNRLTDAELDAIRGRLAAATPGPWRAEYSGSTGPVVMDAESVDARDHVARCPHYRGHADAGFIAHAPTDVADLLAEVERLRAVEQNLRDIIAGATVEYAMAYRWPNGNVVPFGSASCYRAGVQRDVDKANRAEHWNSALLARRLVTRWTPAEDGAP